MKIEFYGVRGSIPTPGKDTVAFGGNTSCVHVTLNNGNALVLDAGTGIMKLGRKLILDRSPITILITHNHWDHIQGFPFFQPIFQKARDITLITGEIEHDDNDIVLKQMSGSNHPVKYDELPANIKLETELSKQNSFNINSFKIKTQKLNHPDGGTAYAIYGDNKKLAYVTDNELTPPYEPTTTWQQWVDFVSNADLLIHDAQYTEEELPARTGWGHSAYQQVLELAQHANVKRLYFISHDPMRTDEELSKIEQIIQSQVNNITVAFAREGSIIKMDNN